MGKVVNDALVDVFVIGGGINGVGVARDAAGRGYSVCLCEAGDLASGTSSASSKLIHGGLRYLEHYEFRLVREALKEREVLLRMAPHITWPMRFVLPHLKGMRPLWLLRVGLFIYDHLGRRKWLPSTRRLNLKKDDAGAALKPEYKSALEYSDCWVDDARMVVINAMDAQQKGAEINVHTHVTDVRPEKGYWRVTTHNQRTGEVRYVGARLVVNAAGPWVDKVLHQTFNFKAANHVRLVRGSHIVVRKLFDHDRTYIFQNADERIIFAIPYQDHFTLIGTTDQDHGELTGEVIISEEEQHYLCESANQYFSKQITAGDIIWSYSGVRPLYDDGASEAQQATRDYVVETKNIEGAMLVNIFGGKITTYRKLSELILENIEQFLGKKGKRWTRHSRLPGGDFDVGNAHELTTEYSRRWPFIPNKLMTRYVRSYGSLTQALLQGIASLNDMGKCFGDDLYQVEVDYLVQHEWAFKAEDILFRRSKLGLSFSPESVAKLERYLEKSEPTKKFAINNEEPVFTN